MTDVSQTVVIPPEAFTELIAELERKPLHISTTRKIAGTGQSLAFGIVNRRRVPPDYSRNCWARPYLYKLILDFAQKYVDIPYQGIMLNQNYQAMKHRDRGNVGVSYLVAFGNYTGGELEVCEGEHAGKYNMNSKPIKLDFSQTYHMVHPFEGNRYSLVFYTLKKQVPATVPPPSVVQQGTKWVFMRGNEVCTQLMDHPHIGHKYKRTPNVTIAFN
jgi:hypothetical protein